MYNAFIIINRETLHHLEIMHLAMCVHPCLSWQPKMTYQSAKLVCVSVDLADTLADRVDRLSILCI